MNRILSGNSPSNARDVYQFIEKNCNDVLSSKEGHVSVILTMLVMKLEENKPEERNEIKEVLDKVMNSYKDVFVNGIDKMITALISKYYKQQNNSNNMFAQMMQSMMQQQTHSN